MPTPTMSQAPDLAYIERLVASTHAESPELRLVARRNLLRALRSGNQFQTRSGELVSSSAHAMASWGAL